MSQNQVSRRFFVTGAAAGISAGALLGTSSDAEAQLVWKYPQWNHAGLEKIIKDPARIKQVFEIAPIGDTEIFSGIKNSWNGLHFGFNIPADQIKIVGALHGTAHLLLYDDSMWSKYRLGEFTKVNDPETGKPSVRNIAYPSKHATEPPSVVNDPDDTHSLYQDTSIQALQERGVQFLSCHTALEGQAKAIVKRNQLTVSSEDVVQDMMAHTVPGALVVAAMVAAIALLQCEGKYAYTKGGG